MARDTWRYILENLVDEKGGEWWWSVDDDKRVNHTDDKAGFWKCPYHNSRMAIETVLLLEGRVPLKCHGEGKD